MNRINQAKWCKTHKRPLEHEDEDEWYAVYCPGHFRVSFPRHKDATYKWMLERFGIGGHTHALYGR